MISGSQCYCFVNSEQNSCGKSVWGIAVLILSWRGRFHLQNMLRIKDNK